MIAFVLQYNKRDLPDAAPVNYLNFAFNPKNCPAMEATALESHGVVESLETVCQKVVQNYSENKLGVAPPF
ncbi:Mutual gliding-motility protein MglA [compost metagenome]